MIAYHGKPEVKSFFLDRAKAHRLADEIAHGSYYEVRGDKVACCAVGCVLHHGGHSDYETELGVPRAIARLEDGIFERLAAPHDLEFPVRFLEAIPVGADLSLVVSRFLHWLLVDETDGVIRFAKPLGKAAIQGVADLLARKIAGEDISLEEWDKARSAASAAAYAAYDASAAYAASAAASAAYDASAYAASAYAADASAASAAYDASAYAASAASAASAYAADASAAYAASAASAYAYAAYAADAYADAYADADARERASIRQSEKLLELLAGAPMPVPANA